MGKKFVNDKYGILTIIGLFLPVPISNFKSIFKNSKYGWDFSYTVGCLPVGWIMIIISIIF